MRMHAIRGGGRGESGAARHAARDLVPDVVPDLGPDRGNNRSVPFVDRRDAGRALGAALAFLGLVRPVVLGLARGGVVVAAEVARALDAPLDVLLVRKLGYPLQPELAMGAVGEGGVRVMNEALVARLDVPDTVIDQVAADETAELVRRLHAYRGGGSALDVSGRNVVVVDDGLATGATARAGVAVVRSLGAASVVLAVPVASPPALAQLSDEAEGVVCLDVSEHFVGISQRYLDFSQVSDDEVRAVLAETR